MVSDGIADSGIGSHNDELLIIDSGILDEDFLLAGLPGSVEVLRLQAGKDPMAQIARALTARFGVKRLHIACESTSGALALAGFKVDEAYLAARTSALSTIAFSMASDPELLLWTNALGLGVETQSFVACLSNALGAKVTVARMGKGDMEGPSNPFPVAAEAA